jgi:hypothetical protein
VVKNSAISGLGQLFSTLPPLHPNNPANPAPAKVIKKGEIAYKITTAIKMEIVLGESNQEINFAIFIKPHCVVKLWHWIRDFTADEGRKIPS